MTKRRDFIKKSVIGTAGITIGGFGFSTKSYASITGANDRINVAVIGIRGRGTSHISSYCSLKDSHNVRLMTLCDVDEQFFEARAKTVTDKTGIKPSTEWDMRKVFENKDIHAISLATPNHWHALGSIWACQAGKHVYVEKPACHNVFEGQKIIEASRRYNVRVQVGSQNRSIVNIMEAIKLLHEGAIGDIYMARGLCYKPRDSFGISKDSTPPANLHYDMWLGPAPDRPYNEKRLHYNWHWFWDTGNGDTGNQGVNEMEVLRWGLNKNELPVSIFSDGGIFGIDPKECEQETPNTQSSIFKYSDGKIIEFETRGRYTNGEAGFTLSGERAYLGHMFYGTEGYMQIESGTGLWKAFRQRETQPFKSSGDKDNSKQLISADIDHQANFIDSIRSGKSDNLRCPITDGFYSSALPALANISYRVGRKLKYNKDTGKFVNDTEADAMLTRAYRKPFEVPGKV